ncbi:MAG: NAD-dependent deacylase [Pseudomonadota bacterium]
MHVFVLTGAGISAESGLGTFRDKGGLWEKFDPMQLATPEAFARDPVRVHEFYNYRRRNMIDAEPNAAHAALARLERGLAENGGGVFLCTQNIDDLHERAGSRHVHHMHGELLKSRCARCGAQEDCRQDLSILDTCSSCGRDNSLRPDVVWFGEMPYGLEEIEAALEASELFVSIGTSGSVYPAAGYVELARSLGIETCEINLEPSDNAYVFDRRIYGPASESVPAFVDALLAN